MKIQLNKIQLFIIVLLVLNFIFFYNNYYLLLNGKTTIGKVENFHSLNERSKHTYDIIKFDHGNFEYTLIGQRDVRYDKEQVKIIFDPNDPLNSYEYSFFGFIFYRLLGLILFSFFISIPLFIVKIKKKKFLIVDFSNRRCYIGDNLWGRNEEKKLVELLNNTINLTQMSPYKTLYLIKPYTSKGNEFVNVILQELCLKEQIKISAKYIKLNKNDNKQHLRPFFSLGKYYNPTDNHLTIHNEIFKLFKNNNEIRLHNIQQGIKLKFGIDLNEIKNIVRSDIQNDLTINLKSLELKNKLKTIKKYVHFIDKNIHYLVNQEPEKTIQLLSNLSSTILLLDKESLNVIKNLIKELQHKIPNMLFENLSPFFKSQTIYTPIALLSNQTSFENSFSIFSTSFGGGDFGGGGTGDSW